MKSINIFPWNENFNTGIQVIDAQHKKLVDILNKLASNVAFNSHLPALNEIFDELADYAVYHFQTEEAIWHEHLGSDPEEAAHKRVHEEFVETVTRLRHEESSKPKETLVEETLAFLTRWLAAHILENDRYMALAALAVQSGMPLEAAKARATQQMQGSTRSLIDIILSIYDSLSTNTLQLMREIADHKRDQIELSKLKLAVEQSPNAIMITDLDERVEYVNDAFLRISGFTRDQILGANPRLMGKGKTPAGTIAEMKSALARGESWKGEFINCRNDSGEDYIESTWISPIRQADGSITHYLAIKEDITESKRAEDKLQKLIREQKAILESDLIGIARARGRVISWCNSTFETLLGYEGGELTGKATRTIYPTQQAYEALGTAAYPVIKAGNVYSTEIEFVRKDGSHIWMELTGTMLDPATDETIWSFADISDRKQAEDNLRNSNSLLRTIIDSSPVRVFWKDRESRYLGCNRLFAHDAGFDAPEALIGKTDYEMGWREQAELYRADDKNVMDSGEPKLFFDEPQTTPDGKRLWLRTSKVPIRNAANGEVSGILGIYEDITIQKLTEDLIRKEKQFSDDVINNLPGIFYVLTNEARFVRVNPRFSTITGYNAEELYSMQAIEIFDGHDRRRVENAIRMVFETGNGSVEAELVTKSGEKIAYYFTGHLTNIDGEEYLVGLGTDISARKMVEDQLRISSNYSRALIEASLDPLFTVNAEGYVTDVNRASERVTGCARDTLIGSDFSAYFTEPDKVREGYQQAFAEGFVTDLPLAIRHRSGSVTEVLCNATVYRDDSGRVVGVSVTTHDVTEQRKAQQAISDARDMAERVAKTRSEFLANMSHEIRTPMNGIIGLSKLALNKDLPADVRDYVEKINSSSESLLGILNDILDISKLEAGKFSIDHQHFSLSQLLRDLRGMFNHKAVEKGLAFEFEIAENTPDALIGDALRLQQVLANLTGNALKFTERGKVSITVAPKAVEGSAARLTFSVSDTGIGISEADQHKLFQPFSQVDASASRRFGGTGLGLAISKQLLELMGSQLNVTSHPGRGATFSFDLPVTLASDQLHHLVEHLNGTRNAGDLGQDLREQGRALSGARILVAEDNKINQQVVKEFLKLSCVQVDIANDGAEALLLLDRHPYDAVLMDLHMPVMDGIEATQKMRARPEYASLPIIALSAGVTREERDGCLAAGMNDFLPKPVNPEQMIATLIQWIPAGARATKSPARPGPEERWEEIAALLPAFDLRTLKVLIGGDSDLLKSMLEQFFQENAGESVIIMNKIRDGDLAEAESLLHRFKGAAGNLGATRLHSACQMLDSELKQGRYSKESLNDWLKVFDLTMSALSRALAKLQPAPPVS